MTLNLCNISSFEPGSWSHTSGLFPSFELALVIRSVIFRYRTLAVFICLRSALDRLSSHDYTYQYVYEPGRKYRYSPFHQPTKYLSLGDIHHLINPLTNSLYFLRQIPGARVLFQTTPHWNQLFADLGFSKFWSDLSEERQIGAMLHSAWPLHQI